MVHGDACLPNFLADEWRLVGVVDLGALRVDAVEVDLAATVWSIGYNLGGGWVARFLDRYGYDSSDETVARLGRMFSG